jgi:ParB family chromosome partitioning protein
MMTEHKLKTWPKFFYEILTSRKGFEYRFNDRDFEAGDTLVLQEYYPNSAIQYTGRCIKVVVTNIHHDFPGMPEGYCIMDIKVLGVF